ncbi:uncharacterized protein PRCAT00004550001 [Priceomyces carsonii]|uniref:uncharacterized protein n=1 Tax=Priceomyces carsonii TaxID=28549 RepID=UPI002ED78146|nr:unnamed protein product [Priceomyces carsonii]
MAVFKENTLTVPCISSNCSTTTTPCTTTPPSARNPGTGLLGQISDIKISCNKGTGENENTLRVPADLDVPKLVADDDLTDIDDIEIDTHEEGSSATSSSVFSVVTRNTASASASSVFSDEESSKDAVKDVTPCTEQFKRERNTLMQLIIEYIAAKIKQSLPLAMSGNASANELPLEKFLLILTSRLRLTLPLFFKGIIYLFRYMDLVYLLRYLNQSNNYASYTEMDFPIRELIVGCFNLALSQEKISKNWIAITGLPMEEITSVVRAISMRLNGKFTIKNFELVKLKLEVFRHVKKVTYVV